MPERETRWYRVNATCRLCGGNNLRSILDLGVSPIADRLTRSETSSRTGTRVPLSLHLCDDCALLQIRETIDPKILFGDDYPYLSSTSLTWVEHCRRNALQLIERFGLDGRSHVVEIASNDGYMLRHFKEQGIPVLGVEPSGPAARAALEAGIPTVREFFSIAIADSLRARGAQADLVIANNVLAHVADLHGFLAAVKHIIKDDGVLVVEVPYVADLVASCAFDTVYHQHLCYFSLSTLVTLTARHGMSLFDVKRIPTHGGSLRVFIGAHRHPSPSVTSLLASERVEKVNDAAFYTTFASRVDSLKMRLVELLERLRAGGKRIVAYGAAAKATTLLHYCDIDYRLVDFVVDRNEAKHGLFMPGGGLRIHHPDRLMADPPDYLLLLAWNLRDEILAQQRDFLRGGGRVIVPIPTLEILEFPQ